MMEFDWFQFVTVALLVFTTVTLLRHEKRHRRYAAAIDTQSRINKEQIKMNNTIIEAAKEQRHFNHAAQEIFEKVLHVRIKTTLVDPEEKSRHIN